ncbi:FmdB family zinc ribbon protein [Microbacterium trichothecenolyticum]|jgi:putative FmdB family regulatory protein|uniref:Zinc ribbon domain protein n=1 Tax=Microbacterium trichothecenolyticum TaxID=69370 RepID=A0A0M2HEW2_MICTR|nr:FmdB family zinc ribbon protein [Microbacterium trichothecenolyticum]KJL43246.1 Zinc ribbon domain protein [Microbacterium trichothecenolyticum]
MPTYAYACKQCGHRFDAVQSFADPTLTECPECGGALRKEYGSIGVTFNGSGFYRTDSRAGAKSGGSGSGGGTDAPGGASSSTSTSSKTEAKASPASSGA